MKDNWIQPFQDKLGDYEFDLPAPAKRKIGWWVPLLAGAAAALLLMLLLRTPASRQQPALALALADANPALTVLPTLPDHPEAIRPIRRTMPVAAPARPAAAEPVSSAATETPAEAITPEEVTPIAPANPEPAHTPVSATDNQPDDLSQWIPEEEPSERHRVSLSTKLYAGNIAFKESTPQSAEYQEFWDMRSAKANYAGFAGDAYDFAANSLLNNAVHAYSVQSNNVKETICDLPVKAGLSLQFGLTERLSLESGFLYSYHHSKQTLSGNLNGDYYYDYRLHYAGIPLKFNYAFLQTRRVAAYASLGGEAEMLARGRIIPVDGLSRSSTVVKQHPLQFSLVGSAGAEYRFNPWFGLYAEPGVAYHFKPGGDLPNYYREHPWSFDLRLGLRFRLN